MIGGVWDLTDREWQIMVTLILLCVMSCVSFYWTFYYLLGWKHTITAQFVHAIVGVVSGIMLHALLLGSDTVRHFFIIFLGMWVSFGSSSAVILFRVSWRRT